MLQEHNDDSEIQSDCAARRKNEQSTREQVSEAWGNWVRQAMVDGWAIGNEFAAWWCQSARVAADPAEWSRRNPKLVCRLAELSARAAEQNIALTLNLQGKVAECLTPLGKAGHARGVCDEIRSLIRASVVHWTSAWSQASATWADYWLLPRSPQSNDVH